LGYTVFFNHKIQRNKFAQSWIYNLNEHCQVEGRNNTSPEVEELQLKDAKDGKEKDGSESENLSDCDCDQTVD
jgi:hypothetical protein